MSGADIASRLEGMTIPRRNVLAKAKSAGGSYHLEVMARFEVTITETIRQLEAPVPDHAPTPMVRSVYWAGEAKDQDAAKEAGYAAWDEKYGAGKQPVQATVMVTQLD
jgi:hypothetical protein